MTTNTWGIIDTYFRDTEHYKSQHQLDSFNEFMFSKQNGITNIIKRENPFQLVKGENKDKTSFDYEIKIYFGETLNPDTGNIVSGIENIFITSPGVLKDGKILKLTPNEARLKNLTYQSNILCNIGILYVYNNDKTIKVINLPKVNIGEIPIMIHSKQCMLHKLDPIKLSELGECPYDHGGYFIIKGKEKIIISQEKKVNNILYINSSNDDNIILQGNIKSVSNEGFQSSRTNVVSLMRNNIKVKVNEVEIKRTENTFSVRILGFDIVVPLFVLFRALGVESDKEILSYLIYPNDSKQIHNKLFYELLPSIKESRPIFTQKTAFKMLSLNTKGKENFNVYNILTNNFLPNYGDDNKGKTIYLGYIVRKMLFTHLGINKETNRDSYIYKRIDLAGSLLLELYRELWGNYKRNISRKIDSEYKTLFESSNKTDISMIINDMNYMKILDNKIMKTFPKSFGATFGTGLSARQGIVQDLNRNVMLGTLSHTRRILNPLPSGSKSIGPRKLANSQWGMICPTESPDGGNVGIINHLSIIARVTTNIDENGIFQAMKDGGMLLLKDAINKDIYISTNVFLNGKLVGIHTDPKEFIYFMRMLKLNSFINIGTSISWIIQMNEIHVFSDSGRIIRPVFHLKGTTKKYNKLIQGDNSFIQTWNHAIYGYIFNKVTQDINFETTIYFKEELDTIKRQYKDKYLEYLEEQSAPIEYIDSNETDNSLIARDSKTFEDNHTHCEIHSSLILSAVSLNIPFPEHSQFPRNVFSCQQTKQAVGVYSSAYNTRFETFAHILHYPQRPIVTTRYKKYTDVDKLPYGINAIVAIASYGGYNQEDGILINQSSIERGLFKSLYLRSYEDSEEIKSDGKKIYFNNPIFENNIRKKNTENYEKLDDNGFIKENTYITDKDMICAKCIKSTNSKGQEVTNVIGSHIKHGTSGIVDKVVVYNNKENLRTCKVRIRKEKIPGIGDKFSSRCGQKGMCGMVIPQWDMPITKEGIVPDIIVNPHAIPSRMTINQLLEVILGKTACLGGYLGDATPFQNNDISEFSGTLEGFGYEKNGNEIMYSGITGEQLKTSIFIGPTYYQRLKIMVADKIYSRSTGPLQHLVRQPASGRANQGGLRIGEMERDSIIGHGISYFLKESMMERSDSFKVQVDTRSGLISYDKHTEHKKTISIPYCMKLLLHELQSMSIAPRIITEEGTLNKPVFKYLYETLNKYKI